MKLILEALEFCKENKLYGQHINVALGKNKIPLSLKEGFFFKRLENENYTI